jgi:hypothetical protein
MVAFPVAASAIYYAICSHALLAGEMMKRVLTFIAAASLVAVPAAADFAVSRPKPAKPAAKPPVASPAPDPIRRRPPTARPTAAPRIPVAVARPAAALPGIDPALVQEVIFQAGYGSNTLAVGENGSQKIDVRSGNSTWLAEFKECASPNRCKAVEFSFNWEVMNDANICASWGHYITKDEDGSKGLPVCVVVPPSGKMLRLSLVSTQTPYAGIIRAPRKEAKELLTEMVKTWANYAGRLTEARDIANRRCPRGRTGCWTSEAEKTSPAPRRRTTGPITY